MAQKKLTLLIGYGQSNEGAIGTAPRLTGAAISPNDTANNVRHSSVFGRPNMSLTTTAPYVAPCSIFQKLAEHIALETGWCVDVVNKAVGGTAVTDWVGFNASESRILAQGEAGYDPNGRIDGMVASVQAAVADGFEVWTITSGHQQDLVNYANTRTPAQAIAASAHIQNRLIAAGASKVLVGITPRWLTHSKEVEWNPGGTFHQVQQGVIAAVPGALAGADLSANTDVNLRANDDLPYVHLNHAGVCWAAEKWLNAIKAAKLI